MELSKTQEKVLNEVKREIADAKQFESYEQFFNSKKHYGCYENLTYKEAIEKYGNDDLSYYEDWWKKNKYENIALIESRPQILKKLEKLGYIEIIDERCGFAEVRLIKE